MSIEELKELQAKIIKKEKKCNLIISIFVSIMLLIMLILFLLDIDFMVITVLAVIVIISLIIFVIVKAFLHGDDIQIFDKNFKNIFVKKALEDNFENITYNPDKGFDEELIDEIGMLDTADRYHSNDLITGEYKGIKFECSDIHIQEEHESTDSDGNTTTTWVTIFAGKLMIFEFNKKFKADLQVSSASFGAEDLPWGKRFTKVEMEDIEFNKKFYVYAENEHEAFYILTPHFMEKLKEIEEKINAGIMFCFVDNKLHIALDNNTDSFEYNVYKPINEKEIEENIIKDIKTITYFADELDLDNDLFK
jgi:hypothetical protein